MRTIAFEATAFNRSAISPENSVRRAKCVAANHVKRLCRPLTSEAPQPRSCPYLSRGTLRQPQGAIHLTSMTGAFRKLECPSVPPVAGLLVSSAFMACPELVEGQIIFSHLRKLCVIYGGVLSLSKDAIHLTSMTGAFCQLECPSARHPGNL